MNWCTFQKTALSSTYNVFAPDRSDKSNWLIEVVAQIVFDPVHKEFEHTDFIFIVVSPAGFSQAGASFFLVDVLDVDKDEKKNETNSGPSKTFFK